MPTEIFNPNPTVFSAVKTTGRKSDILAQNLWIDDDAGSDDDLNGVDPIDQDEIYGTPLVPRPILLTLRDPQISFAQSVTQNILILWRSFALFPRRRLTSMETTSWSSLHQLSHTAACQLSSVREGCEVRRTDSDLVLGLSIRVRLLRSLPDRFKVDITLKPGSHQSEHSGKVLPMIDVPRLIPLWRSKQATQR